eukprot:2413144-Pleurochrysis_carterae.AAC.2
MRTTASKSLTSAVRCAAHVSATRTLATAPPHFSAGGRFGCPVCGQRRKRNGSRAALYPCSTLRMPLATHRRCVSASVLIIASARGVCFGKRCSKMARTSRSCMLKLGCCGDASRPVSTSDAR